MNQMRFMQVFIVQRVQQGPMIKQTYNIWTSVTQIGCQPHPGYM